MKKVLCVLSIVVIALSLSPAFAEDEGKQAKKRAKIDKKAQGTLDRLFEETDKAKRLYDRAFAYAVFHNTKVSVGITGGGGKGVAVEKASGARTYMNMGTAGLNVGLGGQSYEVVFLFEDQGTFETFINKGWEAEASANAVAGTAGANVEANFRNGLAVFQMTKAGLMLQADISGTKYWKSGLND